MISYTFDDLTGDLRIFRNPDDIANYLRNVADAIDEGSSTSLDLGFDRFYLYLDSSS